MASAMVAPPSLESVRFERTATKAKNPKLEMRPAYFAEKGRFVRTPVYARALLKTGTKIEGPALIEEAELTCVIGPSARVSVDRHGNLLMKIRFSS